MLISHLIYRVKSDQSCTYVPDNPVYCSSDLVDTMAAMETNNTKILGLMPCAPVEQTLAPPAVE
uniref:Uncharacterized protein n=1 Tax=Timema poppense TaxID=170557 RepID=A0A7R9DWH1_TIMPO|nr:unnamed protein product [Timema poppensis]